MSPIPTLHNFFVRQHEKLVKKRKQQVYTFLACTRREESPSSVLQQHSGLLRLIASSFLPIEVVPPPISCYYKVSSHMCRFPETVSVEALYKKGGWESGINNPPDTITARYDHEWSGALCTKTFSGDGYVQEDWLDEASFLTNPYDGSFLTEGQLRLHFQAFVLAYVCSSTAPGGCGGKCSALPGDTMYWKFTVDDYPRVATRCEPGTDEDLSERGHLSGQSGLLYRECELYREEQQTAQFEEE